MGEFLLVGYISLTLITFAFGIKFLYIFLKKVNEIKGLDTSIAGFIILATIFSPVILLLSMIPIVSQWQLFVETEDLESTCKKVAENLK